MNHIFAFGRDVLLRKLKNARWPFLALLCLALIGTDASAHGVTTGDKGYIQAISGVQLLPFIYLGAKHMVTGYDHLLFLVGVIFFSIASRTSEYTSVCSP